MYNEKPEQENIYLSIISECNKELTALESNLGFMSQPSGVIKEVSTPSRCSLEARLSSLLDVIKEIRKNLVV